MCGGWGEGLGRRQGVLLQIHRIRNISNHKKWKGQEKYFFLALTDLKSIHVVFSPNLILHKLTNGFPQNFSHRTIRILTLLCKWFMKISTDLSFWCENRSKLHYKYRWCLTLEKCTQQRNIIFISGCWYLPIYLF